MESTKKQKWVLGVLAVKIFVESSVDLNLKLLMYRVPDIKVQINSLERLI